MGKIVTKMANVLEVSIDYLIGKSSYLYDQTMIQRIEAIASLTEEKGALFFS